MGFRAILVISCLAVAALSGCSKFARYDGPQVTRIVVFKSSRAMFLLNGDEVLASHEVKLGFAPDGSKLVEGDGKTPEGQYFIDRRNPDSSYYLSLGISYPNDEERAAAKALGEDPGGDIFIHGQRVPGKRDADDWTAGCISITNREMRKVYAMVKLGTPITIHP